MYKTENSKILVLYGVSSAHVGSGTSFGVIDSPIQRERHTNWPHFQASGVKGAMRHHFEKSANLPDGINGKISEVTQQIFGSESFEGEILPGAIAVSDAKLCAYPIRSSAYPFVWVTCPAVLDRLRKDLALVGVKIDDLKLPNIGDGHAISLEGNLSGKILLEDYEVVVGEKYTLPDQIKKVFNQAKRLLLVSNEMYHYAVSSCTEVQAQIAIDSDSGSAKDGSLRYQELLPADSILYISLCWGDSRNEAKVPSESILKCLRQSFSTHIQIGGDQTLGKGLFEINWY